jgi:hypothetical protein
LGLPGLSSAYLFVFLCAGMFTPKAQKSRFKVLITKGSRRALSLRTLVMLFFLAFTLALPVTADAQTGGKKREGKVKKRGNFKLGQYKSRGHADEFARGSAGRKGLFARLFKKDRPAWQNRTTGSSRSNYKENKYLFSWNRTRGKQQNVATIERQKRERHRNRERGNTSFQDRKHKRKKK